MGVRGAAQEIWMCGFACRGAALCCLPQGWVGQVVAEVGWMPCGKGCDGCGAALPPLAWEGLVPRPVGKAFAGAS